jgi:hypothetical protein
MTERSPLVDPSAEIGRGSRVHPTAVVEAGVVVGRDCVIGPYAVLREGSRLGDGVRVDEGAVVGKMPLRGAISILKSEDLPPAEVGDGCLIGAGAAIYRGAILGPRVLVADQATVRERTRIGEGSIVGRGVVVENACTVGRFCKLETEAYITAFSVLEDRVFVAPGVLTSNDNFLGRTKERFKHFKGVTVRRGGRIGVGAVILPGITIGEDGVVAAGSVVTRDVPARMIVLGAPARPFRPVPEEQLLENQDWPDVRADRAREEAS